MGKVIERIRARERRLRLRRLEREYEDWLRTGRSAGGVESEGLSRADRVSTVSRAIARVFGEKK